jgi:Tol biopolymer transport system component
MASGFVAIVLLATGAPPAAATFPGGNGEIAFFRVGLYGDGSTSSSFRTILPDGSAGRVLWPANDPLGHGFTEATPWEMDWSPDGSLVAYTAIGGTLGHDRLLVGDPDTGDRTVILRMADFNDHAFIASVGFSPAGDSLVFCAVDLSRRDSERLYTIGIDGSNPTMVADRALCQADWSATDRLVAVGGANAQRIVTLDPDGSNLTVVVPSSGMSLGLSSPSWKPDASSIAFSRPAGRAGHADLFTVLAAGGAPTSLTHSGRVDEYFPIFSPDGSSIVFTRTSDYFNANSDLFVIDVGGSTVTRLTDTTRFLEQSRSWMAT